MTTGRAYDQKEYRAAKQAVRLLRCHWWPAPGCLGQGTEARPCVPDHEPPLAEGGTNAGIVPACEPCNWRRGAELAARRSSTTGRGYGQRPPAPTAFVADPDDTRW